MNRQAMEKGQRRYRQQQRREAIQRVKAWQAWRDHDYDRAHQPAVIPTDHDIRTYRQATGGAR